LRELARGAVVSVAVFALLPFAVIAAGIALALFFLMISLILALLSDGGADYVGGAGEDMIIESGVRMIPGYYRWLASRRHPVFWGVPLGVALGGLALSGLLATAVIPQEGNTVQSLAEAQAEIERFYLEKGATPGPPRPGSFPGNRWASRSADDSCWTDSRGRSSIRSPGRGRWRPIGFARAATTVAPGVAMTCAYRARRSWDNWGGSSRSIARRAGAGPSGRSWRGSPRCGAKVRSNCAPAA
jgi:hypothetical protein